LDFSGGHLENDLENIETKMLPMPVQKLAKGNSETILGGDLICVLSICLICQVFHLCGEKSQLEIIQRFFGGW